MPGLVDDWLEQNSQFIWLVDGLQIKGLGFNYNSGLDFKICDESLKWCSLKADDSLTLIGS